jgi:hypothetical protein
MLNAKVMKKLLGAVLVESIQPIAGPCASINLNQAGQNRVKRGRNVFRIFRKIPAKFACFNVKIRKLFGFIFFRSRMLGQTNLVRVRHPPSPEAMARQGVSPYRNVMQVFKNE